MKEFTTAVEEVVIEDGRAEKIAALIAEGKSPSEATSQVRSEMIAMLVANGKHPVEAAAEVDGETVIPFKLDGRVMYAHTPTDGQLAFMLASMGRGQTNDSRFASIINIMLETLSEEDKDYFESRLLTHDPKKRLPVKQVETIFEYLTEQWFATDRPTPPSSGSA